MSPAVGLLTVAVVLLVSSAALTGPPSCTAPSARLVAMRPIESRRRNGPGAATPSPVVRAAGACGGGVLAHVVFDGAGPWLASAAAAVAGVVTWTVLGRLEPAAVRRTRDRVVADLPFAVELAVGCLAAGATVERALAAAGEAVSGPVGVAFGEAGTALALGASPAEAFDRWRRDPLLAPLEPFARVLRRSLVAGTALVPAATRFSTELRLAARWEADAAARRVGVRATVPLGLCFLPAFVLLGIVPAVVAGARGLAF